MVEGMQKGESKKVRTLILSRKMFTNKSVLGNENRFK